MFVQTIAPPLPFSKGIRNRTGALAGETVVLPIRVTLNTPFTKEARDLPNISRSKRLTEASCF